MEVVEVVEAEAAAAAGEHSPFTLFYPAFPQAGHITRAGCKLLVIAPFWCRILSGDYQRQCLWTGDAIPAA